MLVPASHSERGLLNRNHEVLHISRFIMNATSQNEKMMGINICIKILGMK